MEITYKEQLLLIETASYRIASMERFMKDFPDTDIAKDYELRLVELRKVLNSLMSV